MSVMTVDDLLTQIADLTSDEQRRVRDELNRTLGQPTSDDVVDDALVSAGLLINHDRPPPADGDAQEFVPVHIVGKPLSESIIEDRR
jgi:hypothetical protein